MELLHYDIPITSLQQKVYIHNFTDIHMASLGCDRQKLQRDITKFKNGLELGECHRWIGGGDWMNNIGPKDRRFDSASISPEFRDYIGGSLFDEERAALCAHFRPIRDQGIGILTGNHEEKIAKVSEHHPAREIARQLDLPYLGYSALIRLGVSYRKGSTKVAGAVVILHIHHGRGAARTPGGKLKMVTDMAQIADADVHLCGHVHEEIPYKRVKPLSVPRKGRMRLRAEERLFVIGRSYQKTYPTDAEPQRAGEFNENRDVRPDYAEQAAYTPGLIGHNGFSIQLGRVWGGGGKSHHVVKLKYEEFD